MLGPAKPNPRNYDRSEGASLSDAFYAVLLCIAVTYILIYLKEIIIPWKVTLGI